MNSRLRLAYFSPLPPTPTGIADYSDELLAALRPLADVTAFTATPSPHYASRPFSDFPSARLAFDLPVYHMGNSQFHAAIFDMLRRYPGVTVLHDWVLHHFMRATSGGRARAYAGLARTRISAEPFDTPLNERVLDASLGLIVHSQYVADLVKAARPSLPVAVIPHLATGRLTPRPTPKETVTFVASGSIQPERQLARIIKAFDAVYATSPEVRLRILGSASASHRPIERLPRRQAFADFLNDIDGGDVMIVLRHPTAGETSGLALRALALGKPLIVVDHGWYAELPDSVALKVDATSPTSLIDAMSRLCNLAVRQRMSDAALNYVDARCQPTDVARQYVTFCRQLIASYASRR